MVEDGCIGGRFLSPRSICVDCTVVQELWGKLGYDSLPRVRWFGSEKGILRCIEQWAAVGVGPSYASFNATGSDDVG